MNSDGRAVRRKLNAIVNIFAAIVGTEGHAGGAHDVVADLPERGGRAFAIVAVHFVVVGVISVTVLREHVAGGRRGRQDAGVLLQDDGVVNSGEIKTRIASRLRIHIVVLEQRVRAVEDSHRSVAVDPVGIAAGSQCEVVILDIGMADARHIDYFRIRAGGEKSHAFDVHKIYF